MPIAKIPQIFALFILLLFIMCGFLGIDLHLASMPAIQKALHTDKTHMQLSVSLYVLGMGLSLFVYGPLSDKYGRKPVVIFGLSLACIACFASAMSTHINVLLAERLAQGLGAGVCSGIGRTVLADMFQGKKLASAASYMGMIVALSPIVAPTIGGYIQHFAGWHTVFVTLGCLFLLSVLLFGLFFAETNHNRKPDAASFLPMLKNYHYILSNPVFVGCTLLSGISISVVIAYSTSSSFILQHDFSLSPVEYGWVTSIAGIGAVLGRFSSTLSIKKYGSKKTILFAQILILFAGLWLGCFILLHCVTVPLIIVAVFLTVLAQAAAQGNCTANALSSFHDRRGAAGTLFGGFQMLITFVTSTVVSFIPDGGIPMLAGVYLVLGVLGIILFMKLLGTKEMA